MLPMSISWPTLMPWTKLNVSSLPPELFPLKDWKTFHRHRKQSKHLSCLCRPNTSHKSKRLLRTVKRFFVELGEELKKHINDRLTSESVVNGASVGAHQQVAINTLINNGVNPDDAYYRITGRRKRKISDVPGWIVSMTNLYELSYRYRTNGFNGPNPLSLADIKQMMEDVGNLEWWEIEFLFLIDQLVSNHNSDVAEK